MRSSNSMLIECMKNEKKNEGNMKGSRWDPYRENDFEKIKTLINSSNEYFIGARENYISIYYKGMSMAKVKSYYNRACNYTISKYYAEGIKEYEYKKSSVIITPKDFWNNANRDIIEKQIKKYIFGERDNVLHLEKVCQQWIMNSNNANPHSEWYYVDMEYIYKDKNNKKHPYGRADLIAIKRKKNDNDKHEVAFVELKLGVGAYKGEKDENEKMLDLKESIYNRKLKDEKIDLGSGLASHMIDLMRFFYEDYFINQVKMEIIEMIKLHKEFGLIDCKSDLANIEEVNQIEDNPYIYIVTYSALPQKEEDLKKEYDKPQLKKMKDEFYYWMFSKTNDKSFVNIVNHEEIQGIIKMKEGFEEDDKMEINGMQIINGKEYKFIFRFIDVNDEKLDNSACI